MVPKRRFRKFAVVSDRQRYDELVAQRGETSVWCRRPTPGFEVSDPEVFTLEQFTIDGVDVTFQRYADSTSQVYVVDLGDEVIRAGKPVVVTFRFCAAAPVAGHSFHLSIDRPTKDLDVELRYDPDVVGQVSLMDFASRGDGGRISDEPDASALRYRYDGWLFPRAGLVFVWTLPSEEAAARAATPASSAEQLPAHHRAPSSPQDNARRMRAV